eukprot:133331-Hanusia_phi.AAC.2
MIVDTSPITQRYSVMFSAIRTMVADSSVDGQGGGDPVEGQEILLSRPAADHGEVLAMVERDVAVHRPHVEPADRPAREPLRIAPPDEEPDAGSDVQRHRHERRHPEDHGGGAGEGYRQTGSRLPDPPAQQEELVQPQPVAGLQRGAADVGEPVEREGGDDGGEVGMAEDLIAVGYPQRSLVLEGRVELQQQVQDEDRICSQVRPESDGAEHAVPGLEGDADGDSNKVVDGNELEEEAPVVVENTVGIQRPAHKQPRFLQPDACLLIS